MLSTLGNLSFTSLTEQRNFSFSLKLFIITFYGFRSSRMYETANYMYTIPPYRFTVYAVGMILGFYLQRSKNSKLTNYQTRLVRIVSTTCLVITIAICASNQSYDSFNSALFASIAPITVNIFIAGIIFLGQAGHKSKK